MPFIPDSPKGVSKDLITSWVDNKIVAADPDNVTITSETFVQILDPGDPAAGVSPMIQVSIKTTVQPK